ncbi:MAG TPA: aminopeptidase, partial [Chitinophagaceae bacterium]|nr:aminopeptidase [Chitinophagaceae bacterium]
EADGTYSEGTKNFLIGVVIHEVGHNFFPMIINSDERQWSWMDEGLNTFVEYLTEELWDNKFPSRRGPAFTITDYMRLPKDQLEPIMTNSENIVQFGPNAYSKPATGLNILRETIMGRELFDFAFKTYAQRWAFKHPTPADFFRTMEDASGEDLDWFWRGWFYNTDPVDLALDTVRAFKIDANAVVEMPNRPQQERRLDRPVVNSFEDISKIRNREDKSVVFETDRDTTLRDFYWKYDRGIIAYDSTYRWKPASMAFENIDEATKQKFDGQYLYEITVSNKGGLVMPVIVEWTFADGTVEVDRIPAQIWRKNENKISKVFLKAKQVTAVKLDPLRETADINEKNNIWPKDTTTQEPTKLRIFKMKQATRGQSSGTNPMQVLQK